MKPKQIAVFGGASPKPEGQPYAEALRLGSWLGEAGFTVLTGGYIGTMEAVSRGAHEAGGFVIGVTCVEIENWRSVQPNPFLDKELRCQTLAERLHVLIEGCDAAIALPGGVGTLAEILYLWNHLLIQAIPVKPLIVVGDAWREIFNTIFVECKDYIPYEQQKLVRLVPDIDSAMQILMVP